MSIIVIVIVLVIIMLLIYIYRNKYETLDSVPSAPLPKTYKIVKSHVKTPKGFVEAAFHSDYMDVLTAFNDIAPDQRQIFNINNVPVTIEEGQDDFIMDIAKHFVDQINEDLDKNVATFRTANSGWDDYVPENKMESGWEKVQRQLGLPTSLYNEPAGKSKVILIEVNNVKKSETENEIRYECTLTIQKENVKDQIIIECSFVIPKGLSNDMSNVLIERVIMMGFTTSQGEGKDRLPADNLYRFDCLEENNMLTGADIVQEMMGKYQLRKQLTHERVDHLDEDAQKHHAEAPKLNTYDTYNMTQTIYDDIEGNKVFD